MLLLLILLPAFCGLVSWFVPADRPRRALLCGAALAEGLLVLSCWVYPPAPMFDGLLALDALGKLVLSLTSLLFLAASFYAVEYLRAEDPGKRRDFKQGMHFTNAPEAVFTACLLFFLASAALVAVAQHMGVIWVGVEATTLVTAPVIYFHRHQRSLEATWKYLILCSVGIALALLGNILLGISVFQPGESSPFLVQDFITQGVAVHPYWFRAAFIFILIGYGTKMGIAPMHNWLPDAHSEAPSLVSALLSGALLNGAFLSLLRLRQISLGVGMVDLCNELFILFGLFSMGLAAMFIVGQGDYKRMLAYSSVEHMGILLLGVGLGSIAGGGALLHMLGHSCVKGALFLLAGNILTRYKTTSLSGVSGLKQDLPASAALWMAGFFAIIGAPPFSLFISELTVLRGAVSTSSLIIAVLYLFFLGIIFVAMITALIKMYRTGSGRNPAEPEPEKILRVAPPAILLGIALLLGLWVPPPVQEALAAAVRLLY